MKLMFYILIRERSLKTIYVMFRVLLIMFAICMSLPASAQEKIVGNYSVNFGIISWEDIQRGFKEKPAVHAEEYHLKMAREMARMHGGGKKGTYHMLVVIDDKRTGQRIDKADVRVTILPEFAIRGEPMKLQPMTMNGYAGFGEFVKFRSSGRRIFKIFFRFSEKEEFKEVDFVKEIHEYVH